jgi:hypothetical protein
LNLVFDIDWVLVHIRKERFPAHRRFKLQLRMDDDNSRSNPFKKKENCENHQAIIQDPLHFLIGPIIRSKAKTIKKAFNEIIQDI